MDEKEFSEIISIVTSQTGITPRESHKAGIMNFIEKRKKEVNLNGLPYSAYLKLNKDEMCILLNAATVNETYFFREESQFTLLKDKIFPELRGKLGGLSVRVPTPNVSMIDFTCSLKKSVTPEDINNAIRRYSDGSLSGILGYTEESLVSCDFNHDSHSAVADLQLTKVIDGTIAHIVAWYDNEWGFANRMLDVSAIMF